MSINPTAITFRLPPKTPFRLSEPVADDATSGIFPHPLAVDGSGAYDPWGSSYESRGWSDTNVFTVTPWTVADLRMQRLSASIRAKPDWTRKRKDKEITAKWKKEAMEQEVLDGRVTEKMWEYVLAELEIYERLMGPEGVQVSAVDGVYQSDSLVSPTLHDSLLQAVKKLEDVPPEELDWHPGSNGQVLDIVHPSLYPVVYGRTMAFASKDGAARKLEDLRVLEAPKPDAKHSHSDQTQTFSEKFQWLPSDVILTPSSSAPDFPTARFASYINNLPPSLHSDIYASLASLFSRFVPLFSRVLTHTLHPHPHRLRVCTYDQYKYEDDEPTQAEDESDDDYYERLETWEEERGPPVVDVTGWDEIIEVTEYKYRPPGHEEEEEEKEEKKTSRAVVEEWLEKYEKNMVDLNEGRLQVIVKIASIKLTPEKPTYDGGSWHVEGMLNEAIVSTGIYYLESENIDDSSLAFRSSVNEPFYYPQSDNNYCTGVWGIEGDEGVLIQELGASPTPGGRCLAFPNTLQHCVSPFALADRSKPGHRTIVCFFLIDPSIRIPSTADVPPQQTGPEWEDSFLDGVQEPAKEGTDDLAGRLRKVPPEVFRMIEREAGTKMTLEEARAFRVELMKERSAKQEKLRETEFEATFNMCEH